MTTPPNSEAEAAAATALIDLSFRLATLRVYLEWTIPSAASMCTTPAQFTALGGFYDDALDMLPSAACVEL